MEAVIKHKNYDTKVKYFVRLRNLIMFRCYAYRGIIKVKSLFISIMLLGAVNTLFAQRIIDSCFQSIELFETADSIKFDNIESSDKLVFRSAGIAEWNGDKWVVSKKMSLVMVYFLF